MIEDGAQAFGALEPTSGSAAAAYSFYPTKNLGGITDGGAVVTDDDELAAVLRLLRAHGHTGDYVHTVVSTNARLSDVAAAALRVGLPRVEAENARRRGDRGAVPRCRTGARVAGRAPAPRVPPVRRPGSRSRRVPAAGLPFDTGVHYPRALTQQPAYERFVRSACPEAERWAAECVSFPCFPEMTDDEIEAVCRAIR